MVARKVLLVLAMGALLSAAACGDDERGESESRRGSGASTRTEPTTGFGTVGTEPSSQPDDPNGGGGGSDDPGGPGPGPGPGPGERPGTGGPTINVGGARIDGKSNAANWQGFSLFDDVPSATGCKPIYVVGDTSVPVTIVDVSVSEPGVFTLEQSGGDCGGYSGQVDCRGFEFPANDGEQTTCGTTVRATNTGIPRTDAAVTFTFTAQCPTATGVPCDDPQVVAAAKPALVTWQVQLPLTAQVYPCTSENFDGSSCPPPTTTSAS